MYPDVRVHPAEFSRVSLTELDTVAGELLKQLGDVKVCVLKGEMGSGKTTLIKAIGRALHVEDTMGSPTFSLVNEYQTLSGKKIYHFDLYRLKSVHEAVDIGAEEYFYSGAYCFVEWPEKIYSLLPEVYGVIRIAVEDEKHRNIQLLIHG